ncbi:MULTISPECIES: hypothetical protein [Actinosynnema]|uniref:hypothetical protein n=1 Tax=Actinosynnema TaxID=40566 RepID=UPI0020A60DEA|nr:hypothetical protein [Actinosynnema pretiosum]MCP2094274.1 hypothetical protein [Actinosynnema pretiosum]
MRINARRVGVTGAHGPLLRPTSLAITPGEPLLVAGDPGDGHTALALVVSGRMKPSTGEVDVPARELRARVALVDSPDVTSPEPGLSLAAVVGEELAVNRKPSGRKAVHDWLAAQHADHWAAARFENVPAAVRCALLLELAAERPGVDTLVLDSPDRHHPDPAAWWALARERATPERSVVVLCTTASAALLGVPAARLGADNSPQTQSENEL